LIAAVGLAEEQPRKLHTYLHIATILNMFVVCGMIEGSPGFMNWAPGFPLPLELLLNKVRGHGWTIYREVLLPGS
jgi:hypothetical protein